MVVKKDNSINSSDITPEKDYLNRRNFIKAAVLAGSTLATAGLYRFMNPPVPPETKTEQIAAVVQPNAEAAKTLAIDDKPNTFSEITNYNNFYEFSTTKSAVAGKAKDFVTRPWKVEVSGLVGKPQTFDIEELLKFEQEERIYRFRCVEGWSMVIPWVGFPLKKILDAVEPLEKAKYVAFETYYDSKQMQSSFFAGIDFPYVEGLRLDEALNPLTLLATGLYGKLLPNQNGAPLRLASPIKLGYKQSKWVTQIVLTSQLMPTKGYWEDQGYEWFGGL